MPETKRPLKVFLCHASTDKPKVRELYRYLRRRGINPWFDEEHLVGGQDWQIEIPKALATSDAIIICLTKNSVDKEGYIQKEIKFALDKALEMPEGRIFLIPVKFEECEVPFALSRYQWVDLTIEFGYSKMMKALKFRASQLERTTVELPKKAVEEENLALEKAAREKEEREAAEKVAREKAEKDAVEKARLEAEERERQKASREKKEGEAAEKTAKEKAAREKAEKESVEKARWETEEQAKIKAAQEKAEREGISREEHEISARGGLEREATETSAKIRSLQKRKLNLKRLIASTVMIFLAIIAVLAIVFPSLNLLNERTEPTPISSTISTESVQVISSPSLLLTTSQTPSLTPTQVDTITPTPTVLIDNDSIAFASESNDHSGIYLMNADGSQQTLLASSSSDDYEVPTWSPDGKQIAFIARPSNTSDIYVATDIYVMNADGSEQTKLTNTPGAYNFPAWSPDGTQISFVKRIPGESDVYIMDINSGQSKQLVKYAISPSWSPDGNKIAFVSVDFLYGDPQTGIPVYKYVIKIINVDGSGLTSTDVEGNDPAWSPDGTRIAFVSQGEVYVMNVDGFRITRLTNMDTHAEFPNWSPDSKRITFASGSNRYPESFDIYIVNADGSSLMQLTSNSIRDTHPAWRP